eukprot:1200598-Prymnesium_polylepis.1
MQSSYILFGVVAGGIYYDEARARPAIKTVAPPPFTRVPLRGCHLCARVTQRAWQFGTLSHKVIFGVHLGVGG